MARRVGTGRALAEGVYEHLVTEELARAWMSVASIIARGNGLSAGRGMTEAQRAVFLPRAARGEFLGAAAMSEPNVGSDLGSISCRARKDGDDWVINGNKYWCTFADGADFMIIIARTSDAPPGKRHLGLSMFFVEKKRGELPKGCSGAPIPKIGYFGWKTWELAFDNFRVDAADLIGKEGHAFYYATSGLETARAHTAARAIGLAQGALDDSIQAVSGIAMLNKMVLGEPRYLPTIVADKTSSNAVVSAVLAALFPALGAAMASHPERGRTLYAQGLRVMLAVMLPISIIVSVPFVMTAICLVSATLALNRIRKLEPGMVFR